MKCKDLKYNFPDYLRNKVNDDLKRAVDEHISNCEKCKNEINHLKSTMEVLNGFRIPEPDEKYFINFLPRLNSKLEDQRNNIRIPGWLTKFALPFSALALSMFLVFIVSRNDGSHSALNKPVSIVIEDTEIDEISSIASPIRESALNSGIESAPEVQKKIDERFMETLLAFNDENLSQNVDMESVINNLSDDEVSEVLDKLKGKP